MIQVECGCQHWLNPGLSIRYYTKFIAVRGADYVLMEGLLADPEYKSVTAALPSHLPNGMKIADARGAREIHARKYVFDVDTGKMSKKVVCEGGFAWWFGTCTSCCCKKGLKIKFIRTGLFRAEEGHQCKPWCARRHSFVNVVFGSLRFNLGSVVTGSSSWMHLSERNSI